MHAKAVEIAWHDNSPIWSVDISRNNRVVTASGDKVARVWQFHDKPHSVMSHQADAIHRTEASETRTVTNSPAAVTKQTCKLAKSSSIRLDAALVEWLCDLRAHATTINVARFSADGLAIATAADHGEIVIWRLDPHGSEPSALSALEEDHPKERWQRDVTLRGHVQDVLDLAWTSDSSRLVSASVDNAIMVWDVSHPSRVPVTLRHHNNFVQGVSVDPFGRLIASMGNDRSLRVFTASSNTWVQVASISSFSDARLFVDDSRFKNFFRRLSWSPDGSVLACPSGIHLPKQSKRVFAVHIFARNQWSFPVVQCGGLPTPPCAVRFSPVLYHLRLSSNSPKHHLESELDSVHSSDKNPFRSFTYRMVFAVACMHTILFYDTECLTRPFATVEGLHCAEHTDLTWSIDGLTVLVSSVDGYISTICFSEEDVGPKLAEHEVPTWLRNPENIHGGSTRSIQEGPTASLSIKSNCPETVTVTNSSNVLRGSSSDPAQLGTRPVNPAGTSQQSAEADGNPVLKNPAISEVIARTSPLAATKTNTAQGYRIALSVPQFENEKAGLIPTGIVEKIVIPKPTMKPSVDESQPPVKRKISFINEHNIVMESSPPVESVDQFQGNSPCVSRTPSSPSDPTDQMRLSATPISAKKRKSSPTNSSTRRQNPAKVQTKFVFKKPNATMIGKTKDEKNDSQSSSSIQNDVVATIASFPGTENS